MTFLHYFWLFWTLRRYFGTILGLETAPQERLFSDFWGQKRGLDLGERFLTFFQKKMQKHEKSKRRFRIVKYNVSWGSQCWKKQAPMRNKKNTSFFHRFFVKNRWQILQNAWKPAMCTKIDKKSCVQRSFLANKLFLVNFWSPPGSPGASRDDPRNSRNRSFLSFIVNCAWKQRWTASERPREGHGGASRRPQGTILLDFWIDFAYQKQTKKYKKCWKKTQKMMKNSWLWLGRLWTLDR